MRKTFKLPFFVLVGLFIPCISHALSPMWGYISLVAGAGDHGLRDGEFYSALFDKPVGLALDPKANRLYVCDEDNHTIRVIDLEENNKVETLAGDGKTGYRDGDFKSASFNHPTLILYIPNGRLLVYDSGNKLFRMLDLKAGKVSTVPTTVDSKGRGLLEGVYGVALSPDENMVYFSQPQLGVLKRMDLSDGEIKAFQPSPQLAQPSALCFFQGHLCAADLELPSVMQVDPAPGPSSGGLTASYKEIGKGIKILSMASSGTTLYALQADDWPWVRITPNAGPVTLMSSWGDLLEKGSQKLSDLLHFDFSTPVVGFIADPVQKGSFYFGLPTLNCVLNMKDYDFEEYKNSESFNENRLMDFSYPTSKPPRTFRIMTSGDSHLFYESEAEKNRWPWGFNRMETMPKRLELFLNTLASLGEQSDHYEVLNESTYGQSSVFLSAYYSNPKIIEKYDVDLDLVFLTNDIEFHYYFERPFSKEGIPGPDIGDPEFFLKKTLEERLKEDNDHVLSDFYRRCVELHKVTFGKENFADFTDLIKDPQLRDELLEITQKPLKLLAEKIKTMKTSTGKPVSLKVIYYPTGNRAGDPTLPMELYRDFWRESCQAAGIPFIDMTDMMTATRLNYFPIADPWGYHHFDHNGHLYFSMLLAYELIKQKFIPLANIIK